MKKGFLSWVKRNNKYTRLRKLPAVSTVCPGDGEAESDCGKCRALDFIQPERHILKTLSWGRADLDS